MQLTTERKNVPSRAHTVIHAENDHIIPIELDGDEISHRREDQGLFLDVVRIAQGEPGEKAQYRIGLVVLPSQ